MKGNDLSPASFFGCGCIPASMFGYLFMRRRYRTSREALEFQSYGGGRAKQGLNTKNNQENAAFALTCSPSLNGWGSFLCKWREFRSLDAPCSINGWKKL